MISRKLLSFRRTVSRKNNEKKIINNNEKLTWNLFKTISVPVVSPENCKSLVNGICVVQRDESDSGDSLSSDDSLDDSVSSQTTVVASAIIFLTMSLWMNLKKWWINNHHRLHNLSFKHRRKPEADKIKFWAWTKKGNNRMKWPKKVILLYSRDFFSLKLLLS